MDAILQKILNDLKNGNLDTVYNYKEYLNNLSICIYNKNILNQNDLDSLKTIINICNIVYNDTDNELLPIEDGIYDLLLEKYKRYDPNFQVGAEIINFNPQINKTANNKYMQDAIIFDKMDDNTPFMKNINIRETNFIDSRDFKNISNTIDAKYISKRKHDTKHSHPELIGSLDKCKFVLNKDAIEKRVFTDSNVKTLERDFFQNHLNRNIISPSENFDIILELKYDGVSIEADCTDIVISARSRGDTGIGVASDFTPILQGYKFPHRSNNAPMVGVKFEAIITKYDLPLFNKAKGYNYANCRSAIVGLLASSDAWKYRDYITLVPLAVENRIYIEKCNCDRIKEIEYLNSEFVSKGCPLRYAIVTGNYIENLQYTKVFLENAEYARKFIQFMYDGIVVSYRDQKIKNKLGRENFINKWSMAVKFNPLSKETVFRGYSYTIGQDGSITPMIHYDPVEFFGTIHSKSSGHSFARFNELSLRIGDVINVEYVNDVMPYVSKPNNIWNQENEKNRPPEKFPEFCPICGFPVQISKSLKSVKCMNENCEGKKLSRIVNTCSKLGMNGFGESTIQQLCIYRFKDLMELLISQNAQLILSNKGFGMVESANMINEARLLLNKEISESQLLGSIGFSNISTKTWELILNNISYIELKQLINTRDIGKVISLLSSIKGVGQVTANTIGKEFGYFQEEIDWMLINGNITKFVSNDGKKKIFFSGFRNKELEKLLNEKGFYCNQNSSVTSDGYMLLVPDYNHISSKTEKAKKYGIKIIDLNDFNNLIKINY